MVLSVEREENARDPLFYRHVRQWLRMFAALAAISVPAITSAAAAGVGIGVEPLKLGSGTGGRLLIAGRNSAPISLYIPIQIVPEFRLEPSVAYFHVRRDQANTPAGGSAYSFSATAVGLGGLFYPVIPAPVGLYVGGRLTLALYSGGFMDQPLPIQARKKVTEIDVFFAPVVGVEYALSRRFGVGAEMQFPIAVYGDESARTVAAANTPNIRSTRFSTDTVLFVRLFF